MSYDTIDIDTSAYESAAERAGAAASAIQSATDALLEAAKGSAGSAGHGAGDTFSNWYEEQTSTVLETAGSLISALYAVSGKFTDTGALHTSAETASAGGPSAATASTPVPLVVIPDVPSIRGGSGSKPEGWQMVEQWIGDVWPDSDTGRLSTLSRGWTTFESALRSARSQHLVDTMSVFAGYQSPELPAAQTQIDQLSDDLNTLAGTAGTISSNLTDFVSQVEAAHQTITQDLLELAATIAGGAVISALLTPLTLGASDLIDAGVDGAELIATGSRITAILTKLGLSVEQIAQYTEQLGEIANGARGVIGAGLRVADTAKDGTGLYRIGARALVSGGKGVVSGATVWGPASMYGEYVATGKIEDPGTTELAAAGGGVVAGFAEGAIIGGAANAADAVGETAESEAPSVSVGLEGEGAVQADAAPGARHLVEDTRPGAVKDAGALAGKLGGALASTATSLVIEKKLTGESLLIDSGKDLLKDKIVVVWPESGAHAW